MRYLNRPLRFVVIPPPQLGPQRHIVPLIRFEDPADSISYRLSLPEFRRLLAHYKRAGHERGQFWLQQQSDLYADIASAKTHTPMLANMLVDPFIDPDWVIQGWQIKFMLSDKLLTLARKQSTLRNWYEDPLVMTTWQTAICVCYTSIQKYHLTFGILPVVGDRLFDEDTGLLIQNRSIDGGLMTITFTLDS